MNHPESLFSTGYLPVELYQRAKDLPRQEILVLQLTGKFGYSALSRNEIVSLAVKIAKDTTLPIVTRYYFLRIGEDFAKGGDEELGDWTSLGPLTYGVGSPSEPETSRDIISFFKELPETEPTQLGKRIRRLDEKIRSEWEETQSLVFLKCPDYSVRALIPPALLIAKDKRLPRIIRHRMLELAETVDALDDSVKLNDAPKLGPLLFVGD